jgi:hypothetical protein
MTKFNKVTEIDTNNGLYKIIWKKPRGCDGICYSPNFKKEILINPNIKNSKWLLKVLCDEYFHSNFWCVDNNEVYAYSTNLANLLWETGFRLREDENEKPKIKKSKKKKKN